MKTNNIKSSGGEYSPIINKDNYKESEKDKTLTSNIRKGTINLNLPLFNNRMIPSEYERTIQHEINHAFQNMKKYRGQTQKMARSYSLINNRYNKSKDLINARNPYTHDLANTYYYLNRSEQDAFTNSLYNNLMSVKPVNIQNFLPSTNEYKILNNLKRILGEIDNWINFTGNGKILFDEARNEFFNSNLTDKQVIGSIKSYLTNEIGNFENKLTGVIAKYEKDIEQNKRELDPKYIEKVKKRFEELARINKKIVSSGNVDKYLTFNDIPKPNKIIN
jgi:hypothetical protein